jgi:hypothetical protein
MYYVINVYQNGLAAHLNRSNCKEVFRSAVMSNAMDETDDDMLQNESEDKGNVRNECEEDESTECEDGDSDTEW